MHRNTVRVGESIDRETIAMGTPTVAKQLIDVLRQTGVDRVYGIVGDNTSNITKCGCSISRFCYSTVSTPTQGFVRERLFEVP